MGIFSRIADIFKANINDVLDKAEDPEKMIKQMVLEMEESVNKATLAVANAIANEKMLERKIEKARKESEEWEFKARQALQAGREDLAKAALERKLISEKNFQDLQPIYLQAKETTNKLRTQLNSLKAKLDEARARQSTLIARSQAAKAQKEIAKNLSGVGSDAFAKFDKYEQKIAKLEAEAVAFEELGNETRSIDDEFKKLTSSSDVEQKLLELKSKMGLLPSNQTSGS
ncbi:MAG: PspA/IM30 family protein [Ignavibacteria bacterium]|nr:PspA/IM30 family protein [Ignavibacteria bacterium]